MSKPPVLLIDDDQAFRRVYVGVLKSAGHEVIEADDRPTATEAMNTHTPSAVVLDLMLPPDGTPEGGIDQLRGIIDRHPGTKVIVASGAGDVRYMVEAVKRGAYDFLTKPVDPDALLIVVERALARANLEAQLRTLEDQLAEATAAGSMIGSSAPFLDCVRLAERVSASDLPVLITGENGTGKELLARSVHGWSRRADGPFVAVNCGAIPDTLMESTFFGHTKGAFTGATADRPGLFNEADGGTLFLDELGDMPPTLQVKVLRALESGEILPVGATRPSHVDVRVVSATNKDLEALEKTGEFREDLYWRIKGVQVHLPPLRERGTDVPLLAVHFLNRARHLTMDGTPRVLSDAAAEALASHGWPGNLRELRHEMQRATVLCGARRAIEPEDLSFTGADRPEPVIGGVGASLPDQVEALERRLIAASLSEHSGNRSATARALGISRQGLLKKMDRYGIE